MVESLIECNPKVLGGKPVIAGTRLSVELVLEKLAAGQSIDQMLADHPRLTREGVRAALAYAADSVRGDLAYPIKLVGS